MQYRFVELLPHETCKAYIIGPADSPNVAIIDPQINHLEEYLEYLKVHNLVLKYVIDTHTHADHISAGAALKKESNCDYIMGATAPAKCVSIRVKDGSEIDFEGLPLEFFQTPGHTKDSISVVLPDKIFTGDALFLDGGGAGRDDLPGGSSEEHFHSLVKLNNLPENLMVYPAHDYRQSQHSTLGYQKKSNPFMQFPNLDDFMEFIDDLQLGPAEWMKNVLNANYTCTTDPKGAWIPLDSPSCEVLGTLDPNVEQEEVAAIPPSELQAKIDVDADFVFVDVRSIQEQSGKLGTIPGAYNIPLSSIMNDVSQLNEFREKEIILICGSGKRSEIAAKMLKHSNYPQPKWVTGGIKAWRKM